MRRLHATLATLAASVYRVKGIVNLAEKPANRCIVQATGIRAAITVGDSWDESGPRSRIVFIGERGGVDGARIRALLTGAADP